MQQATSHGLEDVEPDSITAWFWAVWRFDTHQMSGEVRFGDRECALSLVAAPAGAALDYELWEWTQIDSTGAVLGSLDGQFCDTIERLQHGLDRYSSVFVDSSTASWSVGRAI